MLSGDVNEEQCFRHLNTVIAAGCREDENRYSFLSELSKRTALGGTGRVTLCSCPLCFLPWLLIEAKAVLLVHWLSGEPL